MKVGVLLELGRHSNRFDYLDDKYLGVEIGDIVLVYVKGRLINGLVIEKNYYGGYFLSQKDLDESNKILITFQTNDDYGFSSAWINYKQVSPDYLTQKDTSFYKYRLADLLTSVRSQQLIHNWDISALNLEPEDEIHFTISVADNNSLSGFSCSTCQSSSVMCGIKG